MAKNNLCKSCSGPLDEFKPGDIIKEGFCPYCVDKKGNLKSYADVLTGMLEYIQSDHPEIAEAEKVSTANKWLQEGEAWSQVFKGCIIEESLENKDLLKLCSIIETKVEHDDNPDTNGGEPTWTQHQVEITRAKVEELVNLLSQSLKLPNWWADLSFENEVYIVFRDKIFKGENSDNAFKSKVIEYGRSIRLPESQVPFNS